jgi:hypothetical protein
MKKLLLILILVIMCSSVVRENDIDDVVGAAPAPHCPKGTVEDSKSSICVSSYIKLGDSYHGGLIPCNALIKKIDWGDNEIPECKKEQFPDEWIEHKKIINKIGFTKCERKCNIRQFPLMGSISGNIIGTVKNNQRLVLKARITTIPRSSPWFSSIEEIFPWYRHWYSFEDEGNTYYIWVDNIGFKNQYYNFP